MIKIYKFVLVVSVFLLAACSDNVSGKYDDWEAVSASGSIKRGWIPNWLPRDAKNIQERHNIDTNAIALSFEVPNPNVQFNGVICKESLSAPKPHVRLNTFPSNIHEMANLKICEGFYVYLSGRTYHLWQN